jgi:hypothetical protein
MLSRVRERLLGGAVEGEPLLRVESTGCARDREHGALALSESRQLLDELEGLVSEDSDGPSRLAESFDGESSCALHELSGIAGLASLLEQRVSRVELDGQRAKRVGEDVMDLAAETVSLGERRGSIPFRVRADALGEQLLGLFCTTLVLPSAGTRHEARSRREDTFGDDLPSVWAGEHGDADDDRRHADDTDANGPAWGEGHPGTKRGDCHEADGDWRVGHEETA